MDLNPLVTPNNVLTDALNATLVTNNGNEGVLQNDMGNGRVETAYLPEGYIPVGSCEFGDIIYIASYNPLINKCQLGCFPSPQRNISSSSISDLKQNLTWSDFQKIGEDGQLNGELKTHSVKKIIYENNLTSGDKYIVAADKISNEKYITDIGNTSHIKDNFPKLLKLKLVSIEEDGKITELTNGLKWYSETESGKITDFFIKDAKIDHSEDSDQKPNIDEWRSAVSSAYCIFTSKVSGKLAILAELESIKGFSCTWGVETNEIENKSDESVIQFQNYNLYLLCNWETENNNINPSGIVLTESKWINDNPKVQYLNEETFQLTDDDKKIPKKYNENIYYHRSFSKKYYPEEDFKKNSEEKTYDDFINEYEYSVYEKNIFDNIDQTKPFKNIIRDNDKYYINLNRIENGIYYDEYDNIIKPVDNLTEDIINNYFKYPIKKDFFNIELPIKQKVSIGFKNDIPLKTQFVPLDLSEFVYKYEITPYMPYGMLREYSQSGIIDFSKIGKKIINVNTWKYYNQTGYLTLTWGLEAYTEEKHVIPEVIMEFYDNQGKAAALHVTDKESYNGVFTHYIPFGTSSDLNDKAVDGTKIIHRGLDLTPEQLVYGKEYYIYDKTSGKIISKPLEVNENGYIELPTNKSKLEDLQDQNLLVDGYEIPEEIPEFQYCESDAGKIYGNFLYLVKITTKYAPVGPLNQYDKSSEELITEYRWLWTTTLFNDKYFTVQDFKEEQFELTFDPQIELKTLDTWKLEMRRNDYFKDPSTLSEEISPKNNNLFETLSATQQIIPSSETGNINLKVSGGFQNDHNVFTIKAPKNAQSEEGAKLIIANVYLGEESVSNFPEQPSVKFSNFNDEIYDIQPDNKLAENTDRKDNINSGNRFYFDFINSSTSTTDQLVYIDANYNPINENNDKSYKYITDTLWNLYNVDDKGENKIKFNFFGEHYSKYYYTTETSKQDAKVLKAFISDDSDYSKYKLNSEGIFKEMVGINVGDKSGEATTSGFPIYSFDLQKTSGKNEAFTINISLLADNWTPYDGDKKEHNFNDQMQGKHGEALKNEFPFIFPCIFAKNKGGDNWKVIYQKTGNDDIEISNKYPTIIDKDDNEQNSLFSYIGPCACVDLDGNVNISDYVTEKRPFREYNDKDKKYVLKKGNQTIDDLESVKSEIAPVYYGKRLSTLLKNCFYLDGYELQDVQKINNWVYLDSNYSQYNRDIIVELQCENNANKCISFNQIDYEDYLAQVFKHIPEGTSINEIDPNDKVSDSKNINLILNTCKKTFPFSLQFKYEPPTMAYVQKENISIKSKLSSTIETQIKNLLENQSILPNIIYCAYYLNDPNNPDIQFGQLVSENQKFKLSDEYFSLDTDFISKLEISSGKMRLNNKLYSLGKYTLNLLDNRKRYISDIPANILIFSPEL